MELNENLTEMPGLPDLPDMPSISDEEESEAIEEIDNKEEAGTETKELLDEENPLTDISLRELSKMLTQVADMVKTMEQNWLISKKEFELNDTQMKQLWEYNKIHKTSMPDNLTDEEKENWDHFNGLNNIPEEEVFKIFGEGHPIIGVMNSQTIDRIKNVVSDFYGWISSMHEYKTINEAYMKLIEQEEEKEIQKLKEEIEITDNDEKKKALQNMVDSYYSQKYLDFLAEPLTEIEIDRLVKAYYDKNKIEYWINRCRDRLKQLKIAPKCILEISQFEKRFLPERYHKQSNIFLLYFMTVVIHSDPNSKNDLNKTKSVSMVLALDSIIRNTIADDTKERILNNMMKFEDQFINKIIENEDNEDDGSSTK